MIILLALILVFAAFAAGANGYGRTAVALFGLACYLVYRAPPDDDDSMWGAFVLLMAVGGVIYLVT